MKNKYIILTFFLTGSLMALSLNPHSILPLNFLCMIPVFTMDHKISSNRKYLLLTYITLIIWNFGSLYWILKINWTGAIIIYLTNALIQLIPFVFLRHTEKKLKFIAFVCSWISIEFLQQFGEFAFPFLSLGNSLANYPFLIQFYEYTGVLGGSLLILLININVFLMVRHYLQLRNIKKSFMKFFPYLALIIFIPLIKGFDLFDSPLTSRNHKKIRAIHPQVSVRGEKYSLTNTELTNLYLNLSFTNNSKNDIDFVVWPETSIKDGGWLNNLNNNLSLSIIRDSLSKYKYTNIISGAVIYEAVPKKENKNANIRYQETSDTYYKTYNAVLGLSRLGINNLKVKDKLVPVEEKIPFNGQLGILRKIAPSLGKYSFSNRDNGSKTFMFDGFKISPLICFESVFSHYTSESVKEGAQAIFVLINEGWFNNQFASDQFTAFSKIRAVENDRWVIRSSNYGTTSFITPNGIEKKRMINSKKGYIEETITLNNRKTIFNYFSIYFGYLFLLLTSLTIFRTLFKKLIN